MNTADGLPQVDVRLPRVDDWLPRVDGWLGEPWASSCRRDSDGQMVCAGARVSDLAAAHGTPAYLLDEADFRARARAYRAAFAEAFAPLGADVHLYYAGKALLTKTVARWAVEEGLRVDTASLGESAVALAAGVPGALLGLHGNNKSDDEIGLALDEGFGQIIVDSLGEIDRVADLAAVRGVIAPVLLRLVTGVHAGGHEYISTAHEDQKFGLSVTPPRDGGDSPAMEALLRILARPSLRLLGLHSHIGSQILEVEGFAVAARAVLQLRSDLAGRTGYLMEEVDLGGGYGIAYLPGEPTLDPRQVATSIAAAVGHTCADLGTPVPRISIEPGRSIVGPAGMTLYTVGAVKPVTVAGEASQSGDGATGDDGAEPFQRLYVAVDGGMSDNIRPALYQAVYHAELANRVSSAPLVRARIVGKHCESGDILIHDIDLPSDIGAGDLIAIAATGAYGRSMASNYNLLARPPVIAVRDGETRVLLRRETVADLLALDEG